MRPRTPALRTTSGRARAFRWLALAPLCLTLAGGSLRAAPQTFDLDAGPDLDVLPPATFVELSASLRGPKRLDVPSTRHLEWWQFCGIL